MRLTSLTLLSILIIVITFSGCVSTGLQKPPEGAKIVEFGVPEVGTKVVWKEIRNGDESTHTSTLSKESFGGKMGYVWKIKNNNIHSVWDIQTFNWMGRWSYADEEWTERSKPHNGRMQFPLWAGKSYSANNNFWRKNGWSGYVTTKVKVGDWEKITVPAGTFEVLKIIQSNQHFSTTVWHSPALKYYIKYEIKSQRSGKRSGEILEFAKP